MDRDFPPNGKKKIKEHHKTIEHNKSIFKHEEEQVQKVNKIPSSCCRDLD